jgi:hypothetical protein
MLKHPGFIDGVGRNFDGVDNGVVSAGGYLYWRTVEENSWSLNMLLFFLSVRK